MTSEPVQRSASIEEVSNALLFQPLSRRLAPVLVRLGVSANATSLIGLAAGLGGAACYAYYQTSRGAVLFGFALMCLWHVLDGADGQVARMTNTQSPLGKLIDGVCDYVVYVSAYVVLAVRLQESGTALAWPLVILAGACHAVQASAYEAQRQMFDYWALGKQSARIAPGGGARLLILRGYEWVQRNTSAITDDYLHALERRIGQPGPNNPASAGYAARFARTVRLWGVFSPNYRTYGLFIGCLIDRPELYFVAEIVVLTPLLAMLAARQRRRGWEFVQAG
jgi:phosphatidylglycerophosphate synthase